MRYFYTAREEKLFTFYVDAVSGEDANKKAQMKLEEFIKTKNELKPEIKAKHEYDVKVEIINTPEPHFEDSEVDEEYDNQEGI